ncbi:MAG: hypothetical protein R3C18_03440 [Planctomycetaceae bacterium]
MQIRTALQHVAVIALATCVFHSETFAQRGGFSPDEMFRRMDSNNDGVITANETERLPSFMRDEFKNNGLDFNRGVRREEFERSAEKVFTTIRERFSRGGPPGGPPGSPGGPPSRGPDPRSSDDRRREDDQRRDEDRRREDERRREEERSRSSRPTSQRVVVKSDRITVDLQSKFTEGDTDQDGQIAFYEWRKWKPTELREFLRMDANHDGFLTPKEIKYAETAPVASAAPAGQPVVPASGSRTATPQSTTPVSTSPPSVSANLSEDDRNSVEGKRATFYVGQLDKNKNGTIDPEEWSVSKTIKPQFEQGGVDITKPMPSDLFIAYYIKFNRKD